MQSSYNVIKNSSILPIGEKLINTQYCPDISSDECETSALSEEESQNYNNLIESMLENARRRSEEIIFQAQKDAENFKEKSYAEGYEKGLKVGFDKAYNDTVVVESQRAEEIKKSAEKILFNAKLEYESYLKEKTEEIKLLSVTIAENILMREVSNKDGINEMILNALEDSKNAETFIIKCNSKHGEEIKENLMSWKAKLSFKGDIFIVMDDSISIGKAIIEKNNGKVEVGIEAGLSKIKELLEGD
jgi:flagellar assembly protein FliH